MFLTPLSFLHHRGCVNRIKYRVSSTRSTHHRSFIDSTTVGQAPNAASPFMPHNSSGLKRMGISPFHAAQPHVLVRWADKRGKMYCWLIYYERKTLLNGWQIRLIRLNCSIENVWPAV